MCGIAGIFHTSRIHDVPERLARMSDAIAHRGPDAKGEYVDSFVALAHRRLSIIDPSPSADQPMHDASGRYVILFNGELYNYRELQSQLKEYPYSTHTDTEVILAAWSKWGVGAVNRFDGIFAFALWDQVEEALWLVRDKMGVKPLYYSTSGTILSFSSEIRSLLAGGLLTGRINRQGLSTYLHYHSLGYGTSLINGVEQLEAGTWLKVTKSGSEKKIYYQLSPSAAHAYPDRGEVHRKVLDLLMHSVQKRLMSDVPLGAFLSGGIDSSAVVALMSLATDASAHTFTLSMGTEDNEDEQYAELLSANYRTNHQTIRLAEDEVLQLVMKGLDAMDSPTADGINTYILSSAVRASGFKVALSGMGADELFAGYPGFKVFDVLMKNKAVFDATYPIRKAASFCAKPFMKKENHKWIDILNMSSVHIDQFYPLFRKTTSTEHVQDWMGNEMMKIQHVDGFVNGIQDADPSCQYSLAEQYGYAQSTLLRDADQMGMAVGLEIREPYFDSALWEYLLSIPGSLKLSYPSKRLLTDALYPLLPAELITRKKRGFVLPWQKWMQGEMKSFCEKEIAEFSERNAVQGAAVLRDWNAFNRNDPSVRWIHIWQLVVLNTWLKKMQLDI